MRWEEADSSYFLNVLILLAVLNFLDVHGTVNRGRKDSLSAAGSPPKAGSAAGPCAGSAPA
ncbi:MAG: hypothetical protein J5775_00500 [Spirochaetales bacterium]|nr:hypothetical protein [Spirochaetales bacterium]